MFSWLHRKGYVQGVFWAVMVCLISSLNDVCIRFLGRLDSLQITFMRFAVSALLLLPVMAVFSRACFKTKHFTFHMTRAVFIYAAIVCWSVGVGSYQTPLSISSTIAQTTALFVLPMAFVFLSEKVSWQCVLATVVGFLGILITIQPQGNSWTFSQLSSWNLGALFLIGAAVLFAASDIFNKILVSNESSLTMMFYIAAGAAVIGAVPAFWVWQSLHLEEIIAAICLGIGANFILYCLLKAFAATKISDLMPYRYLELLFSGTFGYLLFGEEPTIHILLGASIIVVSTFTIGWYEARRNNRPD